MPIQPITLSLLLLVVFLPTARAQATVTVAPNASTFRILHLSDIHYHPQDTSCRDVEPSAFPCTGPSNSTRFIRASRNALL